MDYTVTKFDPVYKRDSKGKVREWRMELGVTAAGAAAHRTISGLVDGEKVTSGWKEVFGKNIGKVNETTNESQAVSEIESLYTKQRDRGYFDSADDIDGFEKFKPMLAQDYAKRGVTFEKGAVYSQPKLDGMRCVARVDGLWSRAGKEIVAVPHIAEALASVFKRYPELVIDGELYNHDLKDDFNKIMSLCRKTKPTVFDLDESREMVQYHVYDLYDPSNPGMKFGGRNEELVNMVKTMLRHSDSVRVVPTLRVDDQSALDQAYQEYITDGYEGQMVRYNTAYENKRSNNLLKRKDFQDDEFDVIRAEEGQGNWAGYIKRFVVDVEGKEVGCGVRGDQAALRALFESDAKPDWAKVRYFGKTEDGSLRFPVVVDYGYGKRED